MECGGAWDHGKYEEAFAAKTAVLGGEGAVGDISSGTYPVKNWREKKR